MMTLSGASQTLVAQRSLCTWNPVRTNRPLFIYPKLYFTSIPTSRNISNNLQKVADFIKFWLMAQLPPTSQTNHIFFRRTTLSLTFLFSSRAPTWIASPHSNSLMWC